MKYKLMHGFRPSIIKWSFGFYTSHSVGFFIKTDKHREVGNYNSKYLSAKEARHKFANLTKSYANKWVNGPIQNPKAKQWIKDMLRLKKAGLVK